MAAPSAARLVLLTLLGFCVALSHQEDSCGAAKLAVASLVPFDTTAFRCAAAWKQQDFILRVRPTSFLNFVFSLHVVAVFVLGFVPDPTANATSLCSE
jgi:hypothetical protein